jgi:serine/threonine-protein kinase RsbW
VGDADRDRAIEHPDSVRLDLPASVKYLNILGGCLAEMLARVEGLPQASLLKHTYAVQLAVHETCVNIVEHAYAGIPAGRIGVTLSLVDRPRQILVETCDHGATFDPAAVAPPDLAEARDGGYGLFLVRQLMDEVSYESRPAENRWRLVKYLT